MKIKYQDRTFLANLHEHRQLAFFIKVVFCLIILFSFLTLTVLLAFPSCVITQFILGAIYVHMKELQHETLHGATRRKGLNRFLGFILGLPMLISYSDYQHQHMLHHKHIGTNRDTEYFTYSHQKAASFYQFVLSLFMFEHYINILKKIINTIVFNKLAVKEHNIRKKIKQEYFFLIAVISVVTSLSVFFQSTLVLKLWFVPFVLFTIPINFLIELPEHALCKKDDTNIFLNTRTIRSNWLMSWFVNGNNYHVEHHYAPHLPIFSLSMLHHEIKDKILHYDESYFAFYKKFLKRIKAQHNLL